MDVYLGDFGAVDALAYGGDEALAWGAGAGDWLDPSAFAFGGDEALAWGAGAWDAGFDESLAFGGGGMPIDAGYETITSMSYDPPYLELPYYEQPSVGAFVPYESGAGVNVTGALGSAAQIGGGLQSMTNLFRSLGDVLYSGAQIARPIADIVTGRPSSTVYPNFGGYYPQTTRPGVFEPGGILSPVAADGGMNWLLIGGVAVAVVMFAGKK